MSFMNEAPRHAGRPRDAHLDEAILRSAREVFFERGYLSTSLTEVARRAGVGTPAIYRRWKSKAAMAMEVFAREMGEEPLADTASIRQNLIDFVRLRIRQWKTPFFHQVALPLLMEGLAEPPANDVIRLRFAEYRIPIIERLRSWIEAGQLRADTDPTRLLDLLMGTVALPLLFGQELPDESEAESIVDQVLTGFATPHP
jgi:AcrR family transcriptional regulator